MNGLTFLALIVLVVGVIAVYRVGVMHGRRAVKAGPSMISGAPPPRQFADRRAPQTGPAPSTAPESAPVPPAATFVDLTQLADFAEDRRRLFGELAQARAEVARYRQVVVDIERDAPPPLLDAPGAPDDLKMIVGVGPALERILYQLGIASYRQIARWSERDIDQIDAKLPEFPGRIRRDGWVNQARELHQSKYGTPPG